MRHGTQSEIAKKAGTSPKYFNDVLSGRCRAGVKLAKRLEAVTGIDKSIWVFEPKRLRQLLDEKYPSERKAA